jgi:Ca2+-binding RTX toxin-like protein
MAAINCGRILGFFLIQFMRHSAAGLDPARIEVAFIRADGVPRGVSGADSKRVWERHVVATVTGTVADDLLVGGSAGDVIDGLDGNDILSGLQGDDALAGGDGDDILRGGSGADFLFGGRGSDVLAGQRIVTEDTDDSDQDVARYDRDLGATRGVIVNLATGTAIDSYGATDVLIDIEGAFGGAFADRLFGGNAANDLYEVFAGLDGADTIRGGSGFDEVRYDRDAAAGGLGGIVANLATGTIRDGFGAVDIVSGIERVRGTAVNDRMTGDGLANEFRGLGGVDSVNGGSGFDWMDYRRDDDAGGTLGVDVDLAASTGTDGFGNAETLISIENVYGTRFDDVADGSATHNRMELGSGNDVGRGQDGNDVLDGGLGNDVLIGGVGKDRLIGGFGIDTLTGNSSNDVFVFDDVASGRDVVTDFKSGLDSFELAAGAFGIAAGHALVLGTDFFLSTTSGGATGAVPSVIYETDAGRVWFDFDGAGAAAPILLALLTGAPAVIAADFNFA